MTSIFFRYVEIILLREEYDIFIHGTPSGLCPPVL